MDDFTKYVSDAVWFAIKTWTWEACGVDQLRKLVTLVEPMAWQGSGGRPGLGDSCKSVPDFVSRSSKGSGGSFELVLRNSSLPVDDNCAAVLTDTRKSAGPASRLVPLSLTLTAQSHDLESPGGGLIVSPVSDSWNQLPSPVADTSLPGSPSNRSRLPVSRQKSPFALSSELSQNQLTRSVLGRPAALAFPLEDVGPTPPASPSRSHSRSMHAPPRHRSTPSLSNTSSLGAQRLRQAIATPSSTDERVRTT
eukprot:gene14734-22538_t